MKRVAPGGRASHKTPVSGGRAEKTEKVQERVLRRASWSLIANRKRDGGGRFTTVVRREERGVAYDGVDVETERR